MWGCWASWESSNLGQHLGVRAAGRESWEGIMWLHMQINTIYFNYLTLEAVGFRKVQRRRDV